MDVMYIRLQTYWTESQGLSENCDPIKASELTRKHNQAMFHRFQDFYFYWLKFTIFTTKFRWLSGRTSDWRSRGAVFEAEPNFFLVSLITEHHITIHQKSFFVFLSIISDIVLSIRWNREKSSEVCIWPPLWFVYCCFVHFIRLNWFAYGDV